MIKIFFILSLIGSVCYAEDKLEELKFRVLEKTEEQDLKSLTNKDYVVVLAYGDKCPILNKYTNTINELTKKYEEKVSFILVNTVKNVSDRELVQGKSLLTLAPLLFQDSQDSSIKKLGLKTLSEAILLKLSTNEVLYKGSIDDQFTFDLTRGKPNNRYLENAITDVLNGADVKVKHSRVFGCSITF